MQGIQPIRRQVAGQSLGLGSTSQLDPVLIFKGKLRAAAMRPKFHDSADLRWLEGKFLPALRARKNEFSLMSAGLALKRYPELDATFSRIGMDVAQAKADHCIIRSAQCGAHAEGGCARRYFGVGRDDGDPGALVLPLWTVGSGRRGRGQFRCSPICQGRGAKQSLMCSLKYKITRAGVDCDAPGSCSSHYTA